MSAVTPNPLLHMTEEEMESLSQKSKAIYESLQPTLEPAFNNQFIAIHVESGEYALGESSGDAMRAMRKRQPEGRLVMRKIGPEPEWGLAARLLAGRMSAWQQK